VLRGAVSRLLGRKGEDEEKDKADGWGQAAIGRMKRKRVLVTGLRGWVGLMGLLGRQVGFRENWPELEVNVFKLVLNYYLNLNYILIQTSHI
jgi:hypothetical protein